MDNKTIDHIILTGPNQTISRLYPKDETGRHFSSSYFYRKLENGETILRRWIVYSFSKNCVFCFCCRIFNSKFKSNFVSEGCNDWRHLAESIKHHEHSVSHMKCYKKWVETKMRIRKGETIDKREQNLTENEKTTWKNVLLRLLNIILYLAENNIAFRGSSDKLYTPDNGKFLGLVQLLAKFDPIMQEHA